MIGLLAFATVATTPIAEEPVMTALAQCLGSFSPRVLPPTDAAAVPPGLIEGKGVSIAPIVGAGSGAYAYQGTGPRAFTCGIALYGAVSPALIGRIRMRIAGDRRWIAADLSFYDVSRGVAPAQVTYRGDPLARGMAGVALLVRAPDPAVPTVEVQYHAVLVQ